MNWQRIVVFILLAALPWQLVAEPSWLSSTPVSVLRADLADKYPNARIVTVPVVDWGQLQNKLDQVHLSSPNLPIYWVQTTEELKAVPSLAPSKNAVPQRRCASDPVVYEPGPEAGQYPTTRLDSGDSNGSTTVNAAIDAMTRDSSHSSNSDLAIFIFVIAGVVIVFALVAYGAKYFYDAYADENVCPKWWDLTFQTGGFRSSGNSAGYLTALRLATGVEDLTTRIGLAAEFGRVALHVRDSAVDGNADIDSNYWMLGPAIRWYTAGAALSYVSAELLGGRANDADLATVSAARLGYHFPLSEKIRLGLSLGALYTDIRSTGGLVNDTSKYHLMLGIEMGARF